MAHIEVGTEVRCCVKCTPEVLKFIGRNFDNKRVAFLVRKAEGVPLTDDPKELKFAYTSDTRAHFDYLAFVGATGQKTVFLFSVSTVGLGERKRSVKAVLGNLSTLYYAMAIGAFAISIAGWLYHRFS